MRLEMVTKDFDGHQHIRYKHLFYNISEAKWHEALWTCHNWLSVSFEDLAAMVSKHVLGRMPPPRSGRPPRVSTRAPGRRVRA